jgi:RimJ/RimL family protein N-acetyltransferase
MLRDVTEDDLTTFFEQQLDPDANFMAAFTAKDPTDRAVFTRHWQKITTDPTVIARTIIVDGQIVGHVMSYKEDGRCEVTYWLGKEFWGHGIATRALTEFLAGTNRSRPIYARAARDHTSSLRILEKCGFVVISESNGFANARGKEIPELLLELR